MYNFGVNFSVKSDSFSFGVLIVHLLGVLVEDSTPKIYKTKNEYKECFEEDLLSKLNSKKFSMLSNYEELKSFIENITKTRSHPAERMDV